MQESFDIPLKPFSINAMYYTGHKIKTADAKEWSYRIFHQLSQDLIKDQLKRLREHFDPRKHCYSVDLTFIYPRTVLYTKKGVLSARAHDISNIEKPFIDLLFLPKFFKEEPPYGCENLNIDDKFLTSMSSKKMAWEREDHMIKVTIKIQSLDPL